MIERTELKYIMYSGIFAFIYFLIVLEPLKNAIGDNPFNQFFVFNLGVYLIIFIFLKSVTLKTSTDLIGATGLYSLFLALDILSPEYHVTRGGELIVGASLGTSTSDYIFGILGQSLNLTGIGIFIFVYIISPVLLMFIASKTIPNFVERV